MRLSHSQHDLIAQLAHELREPLAVLRGAMEVLRSFGDEPDVRNWVCEALDRQTSQMVRLVGDLLTVPFEPHGQIPIRKQNVEIETIVRNAVESASSSITRRLHKLTISLPPDPITIPADASRLAQVLANLLVNAAKFTPPRGRIELTAARERHELVLRVSDNGVGIANEDLPHVFERYWQSPRNDASVAGGLGIGLAVMREVVQAHGGTVQASSAGPGRGSEFVVRLPQDDWAESRNGDVSLQTDVAAKTARKR